MSVGRILGGFSGNDDGCELSRLGRLQEAQEPSKLCRLKVGQQLPLLEHWGRFSRASRARRAAQTAEFYGMDASSTKIPQQKSVFALTKLAFHVY